VSPIRPEQRALYPDDWPAISARIRGRAGWRCECVGECGHDHRAELDENPAADLVDDLLPVFGPDLSRCLAEHHRPHPVTGSDVVLTTAHLDHDPANCDPANLRAMCQRCHLAYDREHHAQTRSATRAALIEDAGQLEMDLLLHGNAYINAATGVRIDPVDVLVVTRDVPMHPTARHDEMPREDR
jgi:hypothetical protein